MLNSATTKTAPFLSGSSVRALTRCRAPLIDAVFDQSILRSRTEQSPLSSRH